MTNHQAHDLAGALKQIDAAQAALLTRLAESRKPLVAVLLAEDAAPATTPEAYLKLHLLSHRLVKPHGTSLAGIFPLLPNVAWTNEGAVDLGELAERQLEARLKGELLEVFSVDKFPKMTDYVVPSGVRIADTARVRLGAYIGEGTTIMHEGFVNFNAGTAGPGMIEGRVSAGVFVGKGSDLGGGCSTMGTLSGGGNIVISVGEGCLIGANAGIGIPLGDRCTVESGLYITAGTKVARARRPRQPGRSGQGPRHRRAERPAAAPQLAERRGRVQDQQDRHRAERRTARAQLSGIRGGGELAPRVSHPAGSREARRRPIATGTLPEAPVDPGPAGRHTAPTGTALTGATMSLPSPWRADFPGLLGLRRRGPDLPGQRRHRAEAAGGAG